MENVYNQFVGFLIINIIIFMLFFTAFELRNNINSDKNEKNLEKIDNPVIISLLDEEKTKFRIIDYQTFEIKRPSKIKPKNTTYNSIDCFVLKRFNKYWLLTISKNGDVSISQY